MAAPQPPVYPIALPMALGDPDLAAGAIEVERRDLDLVGAFRIADPASYPIAQVKEGLGFLPKRWSQLGARLVVKLRVVRGRTSGMWDERRCLISRGAV
jgi:hypothetical protein